MTPEEIRARALDAAVALLHGHSTTVDAVVSLARVFAEYITGPLPPVSAPLPSAPASETEALNVWGPACTECGHIEGAHTSDGCHVWKHSALGPNRCECTWTGNGAHP